MSEYAIMQQKLLIELSDDGNVAIVLTEQKLRVAIAVFARDKFPSPESKAMLRGLRDLLNEAFPEDAT